MLVTGGRIIDPHHRVDMIGDLLIVEGRISWLGDCLPPSAEPADITIHATGMVVCPGFIDLHCHLREPGFEQKETVATGTRAAARGGFTTVCCMPNTNPPIDCPAVVEYVTARAKAEGIVRVFPIGCITVGQQGKQLVEMGDLAEAGVVAFSDDGQSVADPLLMRRALDWSRLLDIPVSDHCEDKSLTSGGVMNEGGVAARLGLRGMPPAAEETIVARDVHLAQEAGARLHVAHVSTAASVEIIRQAKEKGASISAEVTPHHLTLTEEMILTGNTSTKVNPPLRTRRDVEALLEGLREGVIDAIATDHAPHTAKNKAGAFGEAAFGISGLETALGVLLGLVHRGELGLVTLVSRLTAGPAGLFPFPIELGVFKAGAVGDVAIFDPDREWMVEPATFASKGKSNPWAGCVLKGKSMATVVAGEIVYADDAVRVEIRRE